MEETQSPSKRSPLEEHLWQIRQSLPDAPGVYKYRDESGKIVYVGKARNLKKRVNSYFTRADSLDYKTRVLVSKIRDIEFNVTNTETEALLLENNLIKQHQPKYNIRLRDGKTYPYICIKDERFPRVFPTRKRIDDGSEYYGPYPSGGAMYSLLDFIKKNYQLRTCSYHLSEANIEGEKFRACLEHQIGNCQAPCVGKQSLEDYDADIQQIRKMLKGNFKDVIAELEERVATAAAELNFERAHHLQSRIEQIKKYRRKNTVVSDKINDVEVVTIKSRDNLAIVNHFKILNGAIIKTHAFDVWLKNDETERDVMLAAISRLMSDDRHFSQKVYTNFPEIAEEELLEGYAVTCPKSGDQQKALKLSEKNCDAMLEEKINVSRLKRNETKTEALLKQAQQDLRLVRTPKHIECFDNSNIQGYMPTSSVVVFKDGKPSRKDYRVYNVRTVEGPDDFATMYEAVTRRYKGLLEEEKPLPDLVVIDGGKGQLRSAVNALSDLGVDGKIAIVSIAKRLEEIYYKDDPVPLYIDKKSPTLHLIQRLRDEAHNAAINHHRKRRLKGSLKTQLTDVPGVGPATARKLLSKLNSVKRVREADLETLSEIIGPSKGELVHRHYHPAEYESAPEEKAD